MHARDVPASDEGRMSGRGRSRKTLERLDAAIRILEEIQPATIRAVCYRLFTGGLIDSMKKNNTNAISRLLTEARERNELPWEWIVDETRRAERVSTWDSPEQIIRAAVNGYRKDYWRDQPAWVEVWSEKGTMRGTLAPVLDEYGVTFRVLHGYGSATSLHEIALQTQERDKQLTALYVGDWDPSGLHMSEVDLPERLADYDADVELTRVALHESDGPDLPSFPVESKSRDPRFRWYVGRYGRKCWELDALSPVILRERVEQHILELLDQDAWDHAVKIEAAERASMTEILGKWRSKLRQVSKYS